VVEVSHSIVALGCLLAAAAALPAGPTAAADDAIARLQRGERLTCESAYPVFCGNIHVACAGRSKLAVPELTLEVDGGEASLASSTDDVAGGVASHVGPVSFDDGGALLALPEPNAYFLVGPDGRFSFRIYRRGEALMARGRCR
jgi:hypothetical protein